MNAKLLVFTFFVLLFATLPSQARWAAKEDATYKVNFERRAVKVRKDGSATTVVQRQVEILKDQARVDMGLLRIEHNATISDLRVLKAFTINGDKRIPVPAKDIETKPLASSGPGFDVINQVTIAFPELKVGSKYYFETEEIGRRATIPNLFEYQTPLYGEWYEEYRVRFESEIPLHARKFDPDDDLTIKTENHAIEISLKRDYYRFPMDETGALPDANAVVCFAVSSIKDWSEFPSLTLKAYETDISSALPARFQSIADVAKTQLTDIDQINSVTSQLADSVRYVGDWRALEGLHHPRGLATVADTGFGDCKDYSVTTAAILRKLGFEANAAWIGRGTNWISSPLSKTNISINHAIVFARKSGRDYWIDPTNLTSFAQGLYPDIANRVALVLYPDRIEVKQTPKLEAQAGAIRIRNELRLDRKTKIEAKGTIEFLGRAALPWTGFEISGNKSNRDYQLIGYIAPADTVSKMSFDGLELKERVVRDLKATFAFDQQLRIATTSIGEGHVIPRNYLAGLFHIRKEDRVTDVTMSDPVMLDVETRITGRQLSFRRNLRCSGQSKWADYSREFKKIGSKYVLRDRYSLKVPILLAADVRTEDFAKFQTKLLSCLSDTVLVFR